MGVRDFCQSQHPGYSAGSQALSDLSTQYGHLGHLGLLATVPGLDGTLGRSRAPLHAPPYRGGQGSEGSQQSAEF